VTRPAKQDVSERDACPVILDQIFVREKETDQKDRALILIQSGPKGSSFAVRRLMGGQTPREARR